MSHESQLYSSPRSFQLWRYAVSHSQLLLRSNKTEIEKTRLEVLFKGVECVKLPTALHGLTITESPLQTLTADDVQGIEIDPSFHRCFRVTSNNANGLVIGCAVCFAEDDGDYYDSSSLFSDGAR